MAHLIVGAGAVGLAVGSALLAAGEPVTFVARGETARALRAHGCQRSGLFGERSDPPQRFGVVTELAHWSGAPRSVLVATKAFATGEVARALAAHPQLAGGDAPVVSFQNGLGNAEALAARLPRQRVFCATLFVGFRRTAPQRVDVTVCAKPIQLGSPFAADPSPLAPLVAAIAKGGLPAETNADIAGELWEKALYNCALNPLGALLAVPYGELAGAPETRAIMERVVEEIFAVVRASGERLHWPDAGRYLEHFYRVLLPPTRDHESSMLQDVRAGRRSEIDALCGEIARRASALGVPAPVNTALCDLVRAVEGSR